MIHHHNIAKSCHDIFRGLIKHFLNPFPFGFCKEFVLLHEGCVPCHVSKNNSYKLAHRFVKVVKKRNVIAENCPHPVEQLHSIPNLGIGNLLRDIIHSTSPQSFSLTRSVFKKWHVVSLSGIERRCLTKINSMNAMKLNFTKHFMRFGAVIAGVVLFTFQVNAQNETTTETTVRTQNGVDHNRYRSRRTSATSPGRY